MVHSRVELGRFHALPRESRLSPLAGLFASAFVHVGLLAWGLRSTTSALGTEPVPYSGLITGVAAFGLILVMAVAIFARDSELFFVVVPAMLSGGVYAYTVRAIALDLATTPGALAALLRFGALGVALNLSMAAAALAARTAPIRIRLRLLGADGLWVGWLGLAAVLVASFASRATAPLPLILATTGIIVLQVNLAATQVSTRRHSAMAILVSSVALSLAAVWTASVASSAMTLAGEVLDWDPFINSMRFGWLGAMPLVLAAVVALFPRVEATGVGVKFGRTMVSTTVLGAAISVGLGGAALAQASYALGSSGNASRIVSAGVNASRVPPEVSVKSAKAPYKRKATQAEPGHREASPPPSSSVLSSPEGVAESLSYVGPSSRVIAHVAIEGPLLAGDTEASIRRALKEFAACYERSQKPDRKLDLTLKFTVSGSGSVAAIEPAPSVNADNELFTCLSIALYRIGFPGAKAQSTLTAALEFSPSP